MVGEDFEADGLELGTELGGARDSARVEQGLVLPGPGFAPLVLGEGADAGDEQAALATRAQAHIDLIEAPGRRVHASASA